MASFPETLQNWEEAEEHTLNWKHKASVWNREAY